MDEIYDNITYAKSNSLIRMLCNYLTEEVFQKGLQIYLTRFSYKNATTIDLWKAFKEASDQVLFFLNFLNLKVYKLDKFFDCSILD